MAKVRQQISRDLHDEVGSQLGGIALLSEQNLDRQDLPPDILEELRWMSDVAHNTSDAMRDIVWLIHEEEVTLSEFSLHLQMVCSRVLKGMDYDFSMPTQSLPLVILNLDKKRHFLLAFKEMLRNIKKHADASNVKVDIEWGEVERRFSVKVCDDGKGFDLEKVTRGYGLQNLKERAKALQGTCEFRTERGQGTRIVFMGKV